MKSIQIKYKLKILIVIVVLIISYFGWLELTSSSDMHYNNVDELQNENGQIFYDFYDPRSYFDETEKKEKVSMFDNLKIYYHGDAKQMYAMEFKKIDNECDLSFIVYHDNTVFQEEYQLEKYQQIDDSLPLYEQIENQSLIYIFMTNQKEIILKFENIYRDITDEEIISYRNIAKEMINDAKKIN